jgi:hypothetical protein
MNIKKIRQARKTLGYQREQYEEQVLRDIKHIRAVAENGTANDLIGLKSYVESLEKAYAKLQGTYETQKILDFLGEEL